MEFIKENPLIIDKTDIEKKNQLLNTILSTRDELNKAHINFEFAENDLIDFYAYEIKALQTKLDYLTKLAKMKKIVFNLHYKNAV